MTITKLKTKTLLFNSDLAFNQSLGLPVEVFCPKKHDSIAFGRIQFYTDQHVWINGVKYPRDHFIFFGCQQSA